MLTLHIALQPLPKGTPRDGAQVGSTSASDSWRSIRRPPSLPSPASLPAVPAATCRGMPGGCHFTTHIFVVGCIYIYMGMDQYLLIPFLVGWHTAIYVYMYIYRWMDGWIDRKGSQSRQVEAPAGNSWRQERSESLPEHQRRELGPQLR